MPHAGQIWESLLYALSGAAVLKHERLADGRDAVLAALAGAGFVVEGAAALDDAALKALEPHQLVIICSDGADDDFTFAAVPESELDDHLRAAVRALDGETIEIGTPEYAPELWQAWVEVALATGARDRETLESAGDPLGLDDDAIAALTDRWKSHAFGPLRGGRLDGKRFDRRFTAVSFVIERV
jgi:hypothetical protein